MRPTTVGSFGRRTMRRAVALVAAMVVVGCAEGGAPTAPAVVPDVAGGLAIGTDPVTGATIETDKDDYTPGEIVHLVGRGWQPNETVHLLLTEDPNTHGDLEQTVQADTAGSFSMHFYDVQEHDQGSVFTLTATGEASGSRATLIFTDGVIASATLQVRNAACAAPQGTFAVGATVCAYAGLTITGSGETKYQVRWETPSGTLAATSSGSSDNGITSATFSPTLVVNAAGTWTVRVCDTNSGQGGAACPGTSQRAIATFQVTGANAPPVLASIGSRSIAELTELSFTATATDENIASLQYTLANPANGTFPTGAAITPAGAFTWTPTEVQGPETYRVKVIVTDNGSLTDEEEIEITVSEVNVAPVLAAIGNKSVDELALLSFTATATDADLPANALTFSLIGAPVGASITTGGDFTWTPTEAQGPGLFTFKVRVTDNGTPALFDEEEITVDVAEVNEAPTLTPIGDKSVDELTQLAFTATALDDVPSGLTFSLANPASGIFPAGAAITPAGDFTWTPTEAQGPGTYRVKVIVTDAQLLTDEEEIQITVNEVNVAPVLAGIGNKSVDELEQLSFTATATDADLPPNTLTFSLIGAPAGASITAGGGFTWTPTEAQGPGNYTLKVRVTDNGVPALYDEEEITVTVNEVNLPPVLGAIGNKAVNEGSPLTFTATATDPDLPANTLTFSLDAGAPAGATINSFTGVFTWTPPDGPSSPTITIRVTDNGSPQLSDAETITVTVSNVAPTATFTNNGPVNEGSPILLALTNPQDVPADLPTLQYAFDCGSGSGYGAFGSSASESCPTTDDGTRTVKGKVQDKDGGVTEYTASVAVNNVAPALGALTVSPIVVAVGTPVTASAPFADPGTGDTHTGLINWGDGSSATTATIAFNTSNGTGTASGSRAYTAPGVYKVTLTVTDDDGGSDTESYEFVVVYDPSGGFVTGGGWINSPAGAYKADLNLTGKANFGFVSKYQKGANVPTGNTEFQFHAGGLNFKSTSFLWLVVNQNGKNAQFKGQGTINGQGSYTFMLWATDDLTDTFRIQITDDAGTKPLVYDNALNGVEQALGGGSIVVHTGGKGK